MRQRVLALIGAVALAAPLIASGTAQAVAPRAVPDAPLITSSTAGPQMGTVTLDWIPPNSPGIDNYRIQYHAIDPVGPWVQWGETGDDNSEAIIDDLAGGKQYVFQVAAHNSDGWGPWSADSSPTAPLGIAPPSDIAATPGDGTVDLSWRAASPPPTGYEIQYKAAGAVGTSWSPTRPLGTSSTSYRVTDLDPAKQYFFRVRSSSGGDNVSIWVETQSPVSPGATPLPPTSLIAAAGDGQVALSWAAPYPAPAGYQVQYQVSGSGTWQPATPISVASTSTNVTGLTNGTGYLFQVRSVRGSEVSAWTATTSPVTPNGTWVAPAAPTSVTASAGNSLAFVYWSVPPGNPATNYEVRYSTNNTTWSSPIRTNSTALNYTLTGLSNAVSYYIQVRTINGPQASAWTQLAGVVTPYGAPNPPTGVTGVPGSGQVTVSWIPPVNTGVSVTGYRVQYSTNGGTTWTTAADLNVPTTSVLVSGLSNGVGYVFRVQAKSPSGDSAWSAASPTVVPPGGPSAPTNLVAVAGNASATLTWSASAGTAAFPILGYRVTASPGGLTCVTNATAGTPAPTTCNVTGLTNGQSYTFTVVAISNAGVSPSSTASNAVTPVGGPNPPTGVTAVAGDRSATVSWTPPASAAGGPVTGYRATSSPDGRSCTVSAPATSCTVTGLTNGQAYTFTVVAISATGTSASSAASAPVTPFTTEVTIRITDSSRDGKKITIKGTTQGVDPGDTLDVLLRNSSKGKFQPAGEVVVKSNGTFRWTTTNTQKTWIRVTDGDVVSNTVIIPGR